MIFRGILRRQFAFLCRKTRLYSSPEVIHRMATLHPHFSLVLILMVSYTILITLFHIFDIRLIIQGISSRPYQSRFLNLGHYPKFSEDSHCKGCEKVLINGYELKVISTIDLLILVPSSIDHFEQRQRVRNTWGSAPSTYKDKRVFFFLGKEINGTHQNEIIEENNKYGDIVQADFIDSYYNLTYKTLSMLYWTHYRLSDGRFRPKWIFKCDDDNFMDIFQVESYLHGYDKLTGANVICSKREEAVPSRIDKNSTWYVDFDTWPEPLWPQCCFGPAYFMTPEAVGKILEAHEAANNPFLPFEDIYITGVLARAAGVSLINFHDKIFTNYLGKEKLIIHKGLSHWKLKYIEERWEETVIGALGNSTYQKMKEDNNEEKMLSRMKAIEDLVKKKREKFFEARGKREAKDSEKKQNEPLKKREEALKKPVQPYLFK